MARSMTGFGRGSASAEGLSITVEVKTVNHKHLNIYINGSRSMPELEAQLRQLLTQAFERGSVQASLTLDRDGVLKSVVELDTALVGSYREALERLETALGESRGPKLSLVTALPGVFNVREPAVEPKLLERLLAEATALAIASTNDFRAREGKTLGDELRGRLGQMRKLLEQVLPLSRQSLVQHRARLTERIRELLEGTNIAPDPQRLELEIVLLADRCDVVEEVERLSSHLQQFEGLLDQDEAVGRRLDFLCQEMGRECNTIGSKSQDARLAQTVIELRTENERIREQVQNLE